MSEKLFYKHKNQKQPKKLSKRADSCEVIEQDENYYFIAGYTSGGAPYGITWEEYEKNMKHSMEEHNKEHRVDDEEELPFD